MRQQREEDCGLDRNIPRRSKLLAFMILTLLIWEGYELSRFLALIVGAGLSKFVPTAIVARAAYSIPVSASSCAGQIRTHETPRASIDSDAPRQRDESTPGKRLCACSRRSRHGRQRLNGFLIFQILAIEARHSVLCGTGVARKLPQPITDWRSAQSHSAINLERPASSHADCLRNRAQPACGDVRAVVHAFSASANASPSAIASEYHPPRNVSNQFLKAASARGGSSPINAL